MKHKFIKSVLGQSLLILLTFFINGLVTVSWADSSGLTNNKQPNIIFVLTDDQRYDELGFMNPVIDTPNMDKMATEGAHFKNAFVTTALCSPSRASILTGRYSTWVKTMSSYNCETKSVI
ncbi:sulfatase-like hydrolase/transferase [Paraglaciecola aquimarina]|uniref:Sulfatase-like hydrolase/transferase n=1 Tax=Paraglaciecola algarum TaxID=3050085 RepID=A0ABS9D7Y8_9ALTE|nr:sulfatase-like hydrolase/transferase [Paraglaciecola sp. G1-23]MCF2948480.1 sulfatase-like hydrolase/transferase [Paraglaciecola sp. G1-23]